MTTLIVLEPAQAEAVRGPSASNPAAALEPVALAYGRFMLSVAVLDDSDHAAHRNLIAALPQVELGALEAAGLLPSGDLQAGDS